MRLQRSILLRKFAFLAWIPAFFLLTRGPAVFSNAMFNPDEAEFLAQGKLASNSLFPYEDYFTLTTGPITPEILGLLHSLGITLDLRLAHVYSTIVIISILILFASLISSSYSSLTKFLVLAPVAAAWGSGDRQTFNTDFLSLSSEITPLLFLTLAIYVLTKKNMLTTKLSFYAGILGGLALLTKYQVIALLAAFPVLIMFYSFNSEEISSRKRFRSLVFWSFGVAVPVLVILMLVRIAKNFESASYSLAFVLNYGSGNISTFSQSSILERVVSYFSVAFDSPLVVLALLVLVFLIGLQQQNVDDSNFKKIPRDTFVIFLILLFGYLAAALGGNSFGHYIQLWLWSIGIAISLVLTKTNLTHSLSMSAHAQPHFIAFGFVLVALSFNSASLNWVESGQSVEQSEEMPGTKLNELCEAKSNVMVWGWASELYAYNDWQPPTFFVNNAVHLIGGEDGPDSWNYNVTVNAITDPKTVCVVEAIGPSFFGSIDPELGKISYTDPYLSELLTRYYVQVEVSDSPATVYVRR